MSKAHLDGRQAEHNTDRPNGFGVLAGFEETGRETVRKSFTSGTAAAKPDFFMGGCGPTVPTGPKRKLKTSWLANTNDNKPAHVPHVPKPTKRWTPVAKKSLPPRCKSHDGTMSTSGARKGRKPISFGKKKEEEDTSKEGDEKKEEEEVKKEEPAKTEEPKAEPFPSTASRSVSPKPKLPGATSRSPKSVVAPTPPSPPKKEEEPGWKPSTLNVKKPLHHKEDVKEDAQATSTPGDPCRICATKETELEELKQQVAQLKAEKGDLAKSLKKTKGSQDKNKELKDEVFELKQQLKSAATADDNSKGFYKLENKLNTLKMILDGNVDTSSLEDLKGHVQMLNMIINQDLKREGMKNVWA